MRTHHLNRELWSRSPILFCRRYAIAVEEGKRAIAFEVLEGMRSRLERKGAIAEIEASL